MSEQALRTSLAVLTEGIVAAPLEGIVKTKIKKNQDGSSYLAIYFAGPIRSAGGSAQALAVLIGDYIRINLGLDRYKPTREEIERFVEEVDLYNAEAARLQYLPNPEEIRIAISNIPVEITGEGTEKIEVTGYRNLERIETNQLRGGAVLVLAEGVLQKAPKIIKHMKKFNLRWEWLEELASLRAGKKEEEEWEGESEIKIQPNYKYIKDLIAGRPVLSYPSEKGGLRLRYGRCRTSGFASACLHPATMVILDNFIAVGTQLKTERPGKAVAISACDTIEPPIVKLKDGSVVRVESVEYAEKIKNKIKEILFLGDILISYGDFLENNHVLMPSGYVEEWWEQEVERKGGKVGQTPTPEEALKISEELKVPLHPRYTYFFGNVTKEDLRELATWLCKGEIKNDYLEIEKSKEKRILEILCVPHEVRGNKVIIREYKPLLRVLGLLNDPQGSFKKFMEAYERAENSLQLVNSFGITVRDKAPTYIGARMGRPEKAKERKMQPPVNVLFPIGQAGGRTRDIKKAAQKNYVEVEVARRVCENCNEVTFKTLCPKCGGKTRYEKVEKRKIEIKELLNKAIQHVGNSSNDLKGVMGMTSEFKIPEPLEKGILRSKYRVYVFKDGTARFDATDLPMTHFKPKEIGISIEKLKELGYTHDYMGNPLESEEQVVELKCQDIILPERGGEYLLRVSKFIDELLTNLYGLEPYYKAEKKEDLIGHLVLGLAPHTSAAILGRIIGYSKTSACFAHPYWHAAKRRNCFPGETEVLVEIGGKPQRITFKELYEELYEDEYQENTVYIRKKPKKNIKVFSYDTEKGKVVLTDIKHVMKSNSTGHLIKIKLETGKSFETTYDHEVLIYENGEFKKKKAFEIKKGDLILLPKIDIEHDLHEIDLLQEFSKDKFKELQDIIMVRGIKKFVRKLVNEKGLKKVSKHLKINKKILNNYYGERDSIPLSILLKLLELNDLSIDKVPNCYLGFKRDHTFIK
ncbi:MAG: DNA polymerase II large subunit, partial [Candidatus Hydrothermarchaeota archaeon]